MFQIERTDRVNGPFVRQRSVCFEDGGEKVSLEYLTFHLLEKTGIVEQLFTTRTGGVSEGIFSSMNVSFSRGDDPAHVLRNYERVGKILGCSVENMVVSHQTHTTNIRRVTAEDRGKGVVSPRNYENIDGLITNEKGIALVTFYADCVPLYFVDPEHEAIGLAHSGWRGTVRQMGSCMVKAMQEHFGSRPENLIAAIGPSICQDCYEVSEEVAQSFEEMFPIAETAEIISELQESGCYAYRNQKIRRIVEPGRKPGKYQLDLWLANAVILRKTGILAKHLEITDICTCHNPDYLFSHRASEGKRGNLGAFLMLKE